MDVLWRDTRKKILKPEQAWHRGPQDQLTILRGETDLAPSLQANLLSQVARNPHAKIVSPLLNLSLHNPSSGYALNTRLLVFAACAPSPWAAPEWQARSMRWHCSELTAACPLKGLVGKCSSPVAGTSQDVVSTQQINQYLSQAKTGGRP